MITLGLFFGGGGVGVLMADWLAPGSGVAGLFSFLAWPAAFLLGFYAWAGLAVFALLWRLIRGRGRPHPSEAVIPPGTNGFIWSSLITCGMAGVIAGALSARYGLFMVTGIYLLVGLLYGALCWQLARTGWLPFPKDG